MNKQLVQWEKSVEALIERYRHKIELLKNKDITAFDNQSILTKDIDRDIMWNAPGWIYDRPQIIRRIKGKPISFKTTHKFQLCVVDILRARSSTLKAFFCYDKKINGRTIKNELEFCYHNLNVITRVFDEFVEAYNRHKHGLSIIDKSRNDKYWYEFEYKKVDYDFEYKSVDIDPDVVDVK